MLGWRALLLLLLVCQCGVADQTDGAVARTILMGARNPRPCISTAGAAQSRSSRTSRATRPARARLLRSAHTAGTVRPGAPFGTTGWLRCRRPGGLCGPVERTDLLGTCDALTLYTPASQLPVRGLYVWCPVCSHGGHLEHLADWFAHEDVCPTGCSHRCSLNLVTSLDPSDHM